MPRHPRRSGIHFKPLEFEGIRTGQRRQRKRPDPLAGQLWRIRADWDPGNWPVNRSTARYQVEIRQNDWRDDQMRYTVRVDRTAVHVIDYWDGQPHGARAQQAVTAVLKVLRDVV